MGKKKTKRKRPAPAKADEYWFRQAIWAFNSSGLWSHGRVASWVGQLPGANDNRPLRDALRRESEMVESVRYAMAQLEATRREIARLAGGIGWTRTQACVAWDAFLRQ